MVAFHLKVKMMRIQEWQKAVVRRISGSQAAVCLMWKPVHGGPKYLLAGDLLITSPNLPFPKGEVIRRWLSASLASDYVEAPEALFEWF